MQESAFPKLPKEPGQLPPIPGGWIEEIVEIGARHLILNRPANPDVFLDSDEVIQANNHNDYMPYWTYLWPSAINMARAIQQAPWPLGSEVLELGAGIGLAGLAAQLRGDRVVYSDYDKTALYVCQVNAIKNGFPLPETWAFDWREPVERRFSVIIGCEVTYDAAMHPVLLDLLDRMLAENGICWLADPGRFQSPFFFQMSQARGYSVRIFIESHRQIETPSAEGFQIFELRKKDSLE